MYDERVAELEHLLEQANTQYERLENSMRFVKENANQQTSILGGIIFNLLNNGVLEPHHLEQAITASSWVDSEVIDVLQYHECVPDGWLTREYYVSVTVPVTVCLTVTAKNAEDAEEMARDDLESNGIEYFDMEYNTYYDADYSVEEA